jgi:hypothetical protein
MEAKSNELRELIAAMRNQKTLKAQGKIIKDSFIA